MKKYKTIRYRLALLVLIFISLLAISFKGYTDIQNKEHLINYQIAITLKSERIIGRIEKVAYRDIIKHEDSHELITSLYQELETLLKTGYNRDIKEILKSDTTIRSYESYLEILKLAIVEKQLITFDYEKLNLSNQTIKLELIKKIREYVTFSRTSLVGLIVGLSICFILMTYAFYKEIIKPLRTITRSFSNQEEGHYTIQEINQIKTGNEIGLLVTAYNQLVKKNNMLLTLNEKIYAQRSFDEVFSFIYDNLKSFIPYNRIGIAVITNDGDSIEALTAKSDSEVILDKGYTQTLKTSSLKQIINNHEVRIINDLEVYYKAHPVSGSTSMIIDEGMKSSISLPLFHEDRAIGVVFFSSDKSHIYNEKHQQFLINIANALGTSLEKSFVIENLMISTVRGFAKIVESKDNITGNHIDRISHYSAFVSKNLESSFDEIDEKFITSIKRLSPLHDIGKVGIPDYILNKPGRLTEDEMSIMKTHSLHGAGVLEELLVSIGANEFEMAVDIAKYHHEKVNGTGYPEGLTDAQIPLSARIVALVDVFDALTSERPYKKAFTFEEAIKIIKSDAGIHFDEKIVSIVMEHLDAFKTLYNSLWQ
ncbi:MAG: HD domain-containing protein [Clostridiales bacterium]|nr:HD domain-containing protein [Clostridiales bacterium]